MQWQQGRSRSSLHAYAFSVRLGEWKVHNEKNVGYLPDCLVGLNGQSKYCLPDYQEFIISQDKVFCFNGLKNENSTTKLHNLNE